MRHLYPSVALAVALSVSCASSHQEKRPAHRPSEVTVKTPNAASLVSEITALLGPLPDAQATQAHPLIAQLAQSWSDEAASSNLATEVIDILRAELAAALEGLPPEARLATLQTQVLSRQIDAMSAESLRLAQGAVTQGRTPEAERRAQALRDDAMTLRKAVQALGEDTAARLDRRLQDVVLEAGYVLGSDKMSRRLGRYARDQATP